MVRVRSRLTPFARATGSGWIRHVVQMSADASGWVEPATRARVRATGGSYLWRTAVPGRVPLIVDQSIRAPVTGPATNAGMRRRIRSCERSPPQTGIVPVALSRTRTGVLIPVRSGVEAVRRLTTECVCRCPLRATGSSLLPEVCAGAIWREGRREVGVARRCPGHLAPTGQCHRSRLPGAGSDVRSQHAHDSSLRWVRSHQEPTRGPDRSPALRQPRADPPLR